jgi:hypothetical protein
MSPATVEMDKAPSGEIFAGLGPTNAQIETLEARLLPLAGINAPEIECPLTHQFAPGIYFRTILMRRGLFIIGHEHLTEHFNIVHRGRARVWIEGVVETITGPCVFVSKPGVRKALLILEDMEYSTVHANPTNETDHRVIETWTVKKSAAWLDYHSTLKQLTDHDETR